MNCRLPLVAVVLLFLGTPSRDQTAKKPVPVYLAAGDGVKAISPDGKWQLVVPKGRPSVSTWLTLEETGNLNDDEQKWPLQRNGCEVLWRPDSKGFVVSDPEYANYSFIRVFSTDFQLEGSTPGSPVIDLSVPLDKSFSKLATRYYAPKRYELDEFYARALRWIGNKQLLVGLQARTNEASERSGPVPGIREWYLGFIMSPEKRQILRQLDAAAVQREFGIDLTKQNW